MEDKSTYQKVATHEASKEEVKKCVLLYSGGLDTSIMLKWLQDSYGVEVVALCIDIGQQADDLDAIKAKAIKLGAVEAIVADCKEEYVNEYVAAGIKANASYMGDYHLSTPIGRPLLAKVAVEVAHKYGADCIGHGCTGKGNDQVRLEATILCYDANMKIIAPVREWSMGRNELIDYAHEHGIPVKQTRDVPYSWDDNVWGVTGEGGEIEDPVETPKLKDILQVCNMPEDAPDEKETVKVTYEKGLPVAVNGKKMSLLEVIQILNTMGAKHAVGYTHLIEDRIIGMKVRGVYENPGAHIIVNSHKKLEQLVCSKEENRLKEHMDITWAQLCYDGKWMDPAMTRVNIFNDGINEKVTGDVTCTLYKGKMDVVAIDSKNSLIDMDIATFDRNLNFNQNASAAFIEHYSLGMRLFARKHKDV
jgi:argininosuccinate synthase